ncbi:MAG: uroporphyrinogen decarboxylase family protein [Planctomycetota bacterium]
MSYERGMAGLNLESPEPIPHTEYVSNPDLIEHVTGINARDEKTKGRAMLEFMRAWDYDINWATDTPPFKGPQSWMGSARYSEDQKLREPEYAFKTVEEIMAFDPVEGFGIVNVKETAEFFEKRWRARQANTPFCVQPGGYYNTVFTWCIKTFGWELFMAAAAANYEAFDRILEGFYQVSKPVFEAWSHVPIPFFICHDDIVWTSGPVFHPDWYRKYIFPRYKKLWAPIIEKGVKILFCSDGDFTVFLDDIAEAGASGFIFEPLTNLKTVVEKYGRTHVIVGNIDCRALTFEGKDAVEAEVKRCYDTAGRCPGFFYAVGNHIPYNVPVENALYYFECIRKYGKRR